MGATTSHTRSSPSAMGAAASHVRSSPSMPTACTLFEPKESMTYHFMVPQYSQWARMPAGTALNFDPFMVGGLGYRLNVYPAGFDEESADYVAVFLTIPRSFKYFPEGTCRILFEILDHTGKRAVFDNYTAESGQKTLLREHPWSSRGYVRFVKRSEMEASSCVRRADDSLVIRCTVSRHAEVTKRPDEMFAAEVALSSTEPASREDHWAEDSFDY